MSSAGRAGGQIYIMILIFITFKQISFKKHLKYRSSWRQLCPVQVDLGANIYNYLDFHNFQTSVFQKNISNIDLVGDNCVQCS